MGENVYYSCTHLTNLTCVISSKYSLPPPHSPLPECAYKFGHSVFGECVHSVNVCITHSYPKERIRSEKTLSQLQTSNFLRNISQGLTAQ